MRPKKLVLFENGEINRTIEPISFDGEEPLEQNQIIDGLNARPCFTNAVCKMFRLFYLKQRKQYT